MHLNKNSRRFKKTQDNKSSQATDCPESAGWLLRVIRINHNYGISTQSVHINRVK